MDCLFCSIAAGDIPATIIDSDDASVAFLDIEPFQDGHTLVIPRRHVTSVLDDDGELGRISPMVTKVARRLVDSLGLLESMSSQTPVRLPVRVSIICTCMSFPGTTVSRASTPFGRPCLVALLRRLRPW